MRMIQLALMLVVVSMATAESLMAGVIYSDRSLFNADAGSLTTEGFNSALPLGMDYGDFTVTGTNSPLFTSSAETRMVSEGSRALRFTSDSINGGTAITFTFDDPVLAFAIDIKDWKSTGTQLARLSITTDTLSLNQYVLRDQGTARLPADNLIFFGFIDDNPFTSLTIRSTSANGDTVGLDNLAYQEFVPAAVVPEPSSMAIFAIGAFGIAIGGVRRRRQAVATMAE